MAVNDSSGCCPIATATYANCPAALNANGSKIAGRVGFGPGAVTSTIDGFEFNTDFLLAATYQDSWDGTGSRGVAPVNYCDVQVQSLTLATDTKQVTTNLGLTGLTKCTYIAKLAADKGALAFKLDKADFSKFQMHYVEWADSEMTFMPAVSASPGYFGTYTASTYPMPLYGTYPAGANAQTKQSWNFNGG